MNAKHNIRTLFGWLLLVLFSFSITPRQVLHDVVADHADLSLKTNNAKFAGIERSGFNCDRLNLVAESPFIDAEKAVAILPEQPCTGFVLPAVNKLVPKPTAFSSLRGPPCI